MTDISRILAAEKFIQNGKPDKALGLLNDYLLENPDDLAALNDKGVALNNLQRYAEAIMVFQTVLELNPSDKNAAYNLIMNHLASGNLNNAVRDFEKYRSNFNEEDITAIKQMLAEFKPEQDANLEDLKRHDEELKEHYLSVQQDINEIANRQIFFIIGVPKSGTTWVENLLNGHPDIRCFSESNILKFYNSLVLIANEYNKDVASINGGIGRHNIFAQFSSEIVDHLFSTAVFLLFRDLIKKEDAQCIGMKNPDLVKNLEGVGKWLPKAKFVHIIRDGRDTLTSAWFHNKRLNQEFAQNAKLHDFVSAGVEIWVNMVRKAREYGQENPHRYLEFRYEDLHQNPQPVIGKILEFLSVDSSAEMVSHCLEAGDFRRLSEGRDRGVEDSTSFFRKGKIGDWRNLFDQKANEIFMNRAYQELQTLGYETGL